MKRLAASVLLLALALAMTGCDTTTPQEEMDAYGEALLGNDKLVIDPTAMEDMILELENAHRLSMGMGTMQEFPAVYKFAEAHNDYMIAQNKLSHDNFDARAQRIASETKAEKISENIARYYATPEKVLEAWLASKSHRQAMEGPYSHTSLSVQLDKAGRPYYTQIFLKLD